MTDKTPESDSSTDNDEQNYGTYPEQQAFTRRSTLKALAFSGMCAGVVATTSDALNADDEEEDEDEEAPVPLADDPSDEVYEIEHAICDAVNAARDDNDADLLPFAEDLSALARYHSETMAEAGELSEDSPYYDSFDARFDAAEIPCDDAQWILDYDDTDTSPDMPMMIAGRYVTRWMGEEDFEAILYGDHLVHGTGVAISDDGVIYVTYITCGGAGEGDHDMDDHDVEEEPEAEDDYDDHDDHDDEADEEAEDADDDEEAEDDADDEDADDEEADDADEEEDDEEAEDEDDEDADDEDDAGYELVDEDVPTGVFADNVHGELTVTVEDQDGNTLERYPVEMNGDQYRTDGDGQTVYQIGDGHDDVTTVNVMVADNAMSFDIDHGGNSDLSHTFTVSL